MAGAGEVVQHLIPVYILIVAGAVLRRVGVTKREHDDGILHLVFQVMYPCFILDNILGSESLQSFAPVAWGIGLGFGFPVIGFGLAWLIAGLMGYKKGSGRRTFALSAGVQNFGYTAIPVVVGMWGAGALGVLFVHNLGVEIAIWSVGVMLISGEAKVPWKRLVNGPMVSVVLGLAMIGLGWDGYVSGPARQAMHWLGVGAFPVALFVTGAVMMDLIGTERFSWKASLGGCAVRLAVIPVVMLVLTRFLPAPTSLKEVVLVQSAMPAAMTPILLARLYGGRPGVAVEIVVATTVVSLVTLPIVLLWGRAWLGL